MPRGRYHRPFRRGSQATEEALRQQERGLRREQEMRRASQLLPRRMPWREQTRPSWEPLMTLLQVPSRIQQPPEVQQEVRKRLLKVSIRLSQDVRNTN